MRLRSIVFDLFGEYIRYDGGEIGLRTLVELLAPFGISEDVVRVLMARLRKEGWFETSRVGRQSRYRLTDEGWRLLNTGRDRIFERPVEPWSGQWCLAIEEHEIREQLVLDGRRSQPLDPHQLPTPTNTTPRTGT